MTTTEYALINPVSWRLFAIVTSSLPLADLQRSYPRFIVTPVDDCSDEQLNAYRYWNERP